ncbi:hypothetical protein CDIK_1397 [Cucumispora dikerogammari]|nr:hypothetical protein CDIK_1397 [Cucumispora dikerogammari]
MTFLFWNRHYKVNQNVPRTANNLEAMHRSFNFKCNLAHVNLGRFLEILIEETEMVRVKTIQLQKYIELARKDLKKEEKTKVICFNFENYADIDFLEILNQIHYWKFD